jgi:membrane fusion protein
MPPPDSQLFRAEALQYHLRGEEGRELIRLSPPWTWSLLVVLLAGLGTALALAITGRVEVNGRARGILRPRAGVRLVASRVEGTLARLEVRSSQEVQAGSVLARIEAAPIQAQLLEARRMTEAIRNDFRAGNVRQDRAYAEQEARLQSRLSRLQGAAASHRQSVRRHEQALERCRTLQREGILSVERVDQVCEDLAGAQRQLGTVEQGIDQATQERAALEAHRQEQLWQRIQTIRGAETREQSLAVMLGQTVLEAPEAGTVEALLVKPGELVRAGQPLCKLMPRDAPLHVVTFLPEKDRAFVHGGDVVHLELDQLPYAEFGTLRARVERISADLAAPFEVQEALGETAQAMPPTFRVELVIIDDQAARRARVPLRSGMLLDARFTLRRQRLITLVLDPLRKWIR